MTLTLLISCLLLYLLLVSASCGDVEKGHPEGRCQEAGIGEAAWRKKAGFSFGAGTVKETAYN